MLKHIAIFAALVFASLPAAHALNPKSVDSITLKIIQAGELEITGEVQRANLTLYVPQEGLEEISVSSNAEMSWRYAQDRMGNRIVVMDWIKPSGTVTYRVETVVTNGAKFFSPAEIGSDSRYLNETKSIVLSSGIRQLAYPYEKSWENVARLTQLVYDMVEYDSALSGARRPSDWVLANKRGVCVEHSNLLAALLRAAGIPTRYAVGYAYSAVDEKLIGHAWVEVLASDGTWIPFDPTWLEGGYLDATHVKTGNLLDDSQVELLTYTGTGRIRWTRGEALSDLYGDKVEVISYTERNVTRITLDASSAPKGGFGYVRALVSPESCAISQLKINSCVDSGNNDVLNFYESERKFYACSGKEIYWFFREAGAAGSGDYTCPVSVYDHLGARESIDIESSRRAAGAVSISGPDTAGVNERFTLRANADTDFIFYSPEFGRSRDDDWTLSANRPGSYAFYLYEDGALAIKNVTVLARKEFDISINVPARVNLTGNFTAVVRAKNLGAAESALLVIEFDGARSQTSVKFSAFEEKNISITLEPKSAGVKGITASLQGDTLTTYTASIFVEEPKKSGSFVDSVISAILDALKGIKEFFGGIFARR